MRIRAAGLVVGVAAIAARSPIRTSPNGTWSGAVRDADGDWKLSVSFRSTTEDAAVADVDFPDVDGYARRFTFTSSGSKLHLERGQPNGRVIILDADMRGDSIVGTFAGLGITAPFVLRRTATPPQVVVESTTFTNGSIQLAGSIYRPAAPGTHPAVVEIHGGGPDTRANYESKAIFLARHGITTLIYDKRGTGQSSGDWETASMEDLARDALAGVAMLRRLKYVNPKRVGVEGFSQGGWIAPLAASLDPHIAFVVVGSASGINPMEQSIFQVQNEMRAAGDPDSIVALAVMLRQRLYAAPRGEPRQTLSAELQRLHTMPWFARSGLPDSLSASIPNGVEALLHFEPEPVWHRVHAPVLAYWGEMDTNLPAERSRTIIASALSAAGDADTSFVVYPGSNHSMSRPRAHATSEPALPRVYPTYELIATWLKGHS